MLLRSDELKDVTALRVCCAACMCKTRLNLRSCPSSVRSRTCYKPCACTLAWWSMLLQYLPSTSFSARTWTTLDASCCCCRWWWWCWAGVEAGMVWFTDTDVAHPPLLLLIILSDRSQVRLPTGRNNFLFHRETAISFRDLL